MNSTSTIRSASTAPRPYRWVILALSWAAYTVTAVDRGTWGPAAESVGEHLGVSLAGLAVFATSYYIGYVIANAGGGVLTDWIGPRVVIGCSLSLAGVFMILFGESDSVAMGMLFQACIGLFGGCDYAAGVKLISQWFPAKDRGFALGLFLTATALGTVIANAVVPSLIVHFSWRASYHVFGVVSIVVAILCFILLRNGKSAEPAPRQAPNLRPLARSRDLWLIGLAGFGGVWGTLGFMTWANVLMSKSSNITPVEAGTVVVIFGIAAVAAKPTIGIVSDRLFGGRRKGLSAIVMAGFAVSLLVFGTQNSFTGFLWTAPFLGMAAYAYSPLMVAMLPKLVGVGLAGSASGATNALWQLAATLVPTVVGAVFAASHSLFLAFGALAAGPLVGMILILFVRETTTTDSSKLAITDADKKQSAPV